jgi:hypothetical protein
LRVCADHFAAQIAREGQQKLFEHCGVLGDVMPSSFFHNLLLFWPLNRLLMENSAKRRWNPFFRCF